MENVAISLSKVNSGEVFILSLRPGTGDMISDQMRLGIHELVPALGALGMEPETAEAFYALPLSAKVEWRASLSDRQRRWLLERFSEKKSA